MTNKEFLSNHWFDMWNNKIKLNVSMYSLGRINFRHWMWLVRIRSDLLHLYKMVKDSIPILCIGKILTERGELVSR